MTRAFLVHLEVEETDDLQAISDAISFDLSDAYNVIKVEPWASPSGPTADSTLGTNTTTRYPTF